MVCGWLILLNTWTSCCHHGKSEEKTFFDQNPHGKGHSPPPHSVTTDIQDVSASGPSCACAGSPPDSICRRATTTFRPCTAKPFQRSPRRHRLSNDAANSSRAAGHFHPKCCTPPRIQLARSRVDGRWNLDGHHPIPTNPVVATNQMKPKSNGMTCLYTWHDESTCFVVKPSLLLFTLSNSAGWILISHDFFGGLIHMFSIFCL